MSSSSEQQQAPLPELMTLELEQMSNEDFWEYARQRARAVPEVPVHAEYLECQLDDRVCLIALRDLVAVLSPPHRLARLPGIPAWMTGIKAWRGETIAVINLALYLFPKSKNDISWEANGMLLVVGQIDRRLGLLVPTLGFTSTIKLEQISATTSSTDFLLEEEPDLVEGIYADKPVLNTSALLTKLVQQIGTVATYYG